MSICRFSTLLVLLVTLVFPTLAHANVPGGNGPITFNYDDYGVTGPIGNGALVWWDPSTGADARPTIGPFSPLTNIVGGKLFGSPDAKGVAINSARKVPADARWRGAMVGTNDALGVFVESNPIYPNLVVGADLCSGEARVVAALADGTLLWRRQELRKPDCSVTPGSPSQLIDYVITTAGGLPVRTVFSATGTSTVVDPVGTVFATAGDPNVAYAYRSSGDVGYYRLDLAAGALTRMTTTLPFTPSDISPDGRWIVGGSGLSVQRFDTQTQQVVTLIDSPTASALEPATPVPAAVHDAVVSPDGSQVAVYRLNYSLNINNAATRFDAVLVMGIDGSSPRVLRKLGTMDIMQPATLNWQPAPGLEVKIEGDQLIGDTVELDLGIRNLLTTPVTGLKYDDSGHAAGIIFNTDLYSPPFRAGYAVIAGPAPKLLDAVGPAARNEHQYLLGIHHPGNVQVRGQVTGTAATGAGVSAKDTTYIVARNRDFTPAEERMAFIGAGSTIADEVHATALKSFDSSIDTVNSALQSILPRSERAAAKSVTPLERELAQRSNVPDDALSWLPSDPEDRVLAYVGYMQGTQEGALRWLDNKLGSVNAAVVGIPMEYWATQIIDGDNQISTWSAVQEEGAYWSAKAGPGVKSFATTASAVLMGDPTQQHILRQEAEKSFLAIEKQIRSLPATARAEAMRIATEIKRNPHQGGRKLGNVHGRIKMQIGWTAAETLITPNKLGIVSSMKRMGPKLKAGVALVDDVEDAGRTLRSIRTVAKLDDALPTVAKLGMPKADQTRWSTIVTKIEESVKARGFDLKLQLSFRPRNEFSAAIPNGLGKNMFMKHGKAGTELDVILGMDPKGLGQYAVYQPKLPPNFRELPAPLQQQMQERVTEMRAGYREWFDPKSAVGKAQRKGGVELTGTIGQVPTNINPTTKIKFKLSGKERNGTILVSYDELVVDGKKIVKLGDAPHPVVSDYDGNAILQVGGKDLPPAARHFIELEAMRHSREAGGDMAVSFHGFTHNGFDVGATTYRNVFKFVLEGMTEQQKQAHIAKYFNKFKAVDPDFADKFETYKHGDYVVRVTRDGATVGQGL